MLLHEPLFGNLLAFLTGPTQGLSKNASGGFTEMALLSAVRSEVVVPKASVGSRWAGTLLVLAGMLTISLLAGEAFAKVRVGGSQSERLNGTAGTETLVGRDGRDIIYGLAGDDGLSGGRGGDEIYGGAGRDVMFGGAGNDFIEARDGDPDYISCGAGRQDVVSADHKDEVSDDCEHVYRS